MTEDTMSPQMFSNAYAPEKTFWNKFFLANNITNYKDAVAASENLRAQSQKTN